MLWEKAGAKLFRKLFAAILTDNGTEFSDPDMIECFRPDPEHNPTKLDSRGIKVWFTDPYCSSQKPHIERFHLTSGASSRKARPSICFRKKA
jgi:transposase InsO family protein